VALDTRPRDINEALEGTFGTAWHSMWVRGSVGRVTQAMGTCLSLPSDLMTRCTQQLFIAPQIYIMQRTTATTRLCCMPTLHEHLPHATLANSPATLRHRPRLCLCVDTLARLGSIDTTVDNIASLGMEIPTTRTRPPMALQLPSVLKHFNTDYKTSDSQQASSSLRCFTMPVDPQFAVHLTCVHC
jgi:hypothetical protein